MSVGYTIEQLENWLSLQISSLLIPMAIMLLLLLFCARRFSLHVKKQMLNMEPQQLSQLLIQQSVRLPVFEGLIAIDSDYKITAINQTARRLLNLSQPERRWQTDQQRYLAGGLLLRCARQDEIVTFSGASRMAVILNNEPRGLEFAAKTMEHL